MLLLTGARSEALFNSVISEMIRSNFAPGEIVHLCRLRHLGYTKNRREGF